MEPDEPQGITRDDVEGLRGDTQRLNDSVEHLAERQRITDEAVAKKVDQTTLDALAELDEGRRSNRRRATAALALVLLALVAVVVVVALFVKSNSDRIDEQQQSRNDARAVACQNANETSERQRGLWQGLLSLPNARPPSPETLAAFNRLLDEAHPIRDCSPAGIEAYYKK